MSRKDIDTFSEDRITVQLGAGASLQENHESFIGLEVPYIDIGIDEPNTARLLRGETLCLFCDPHAPSPSTLPCEDFRDKAADYAEGWWGAIGDGEIFAVKLEVKVTGYAYRNLKD